MQFCKVKFSNLVHNKKQQHKTSTWPDGTLQVTRRTVNQPVQVATKEEESKSIFISYGGELDVSQFVKQLKRDLEANGYSVWLDLESIPSGSDWHGVIGTGLQECAAIIPIITQKYIGSQFCMNELYTADSDKKLIFPSCMRKSTYQTQRLVEQ